MPLLSLTLILLQTQAPNVSLRSQVEARIARAPARAVGVYYRDLASGDSLTVGSAVRFHAAARQAGAELVFTRFTVPEGEGGLVRNTGFMRAVGDAQESFRPGAAGAQLIPEMSQLATNAYIADNQKLSGLAGNDLPHWLTSRGITTVFITGVATNLTV